MVPLDRFRDLGFRNQAHWLDSPKTKGGNKSSPFEYCHVSNWMGNIIYLAFTRIFRIQAVNLVSFLRGINLFNI